jgi:hypothetical protein
MNVTQASLIHGTINSANKALRPAGIVGSKFIEEPYEASNFTNQNKKGKGQNPKQ